jgi:hypothetical protein
MNGHSLLFAFHDEKVERLAWLNDDLIGEAGRDQYHLARLDLLGLCPNESGATNLAVIHAFIPRANAADRIKGQRACLGYAGQSTSVSSACAQIRKTKPVKRTIAILMVKALLENFLISIDYPSFSYRRISGLARSSLQGDNV